MIDPAQVSAVLVTRGDVDLLPIVKSITDAGVTGIIVWDNSERDDLQVVGRYRAAFEAQERGAGDVFYTQDDDCIVPVAELLAAYQGEDLLVNIPAGEKPWLAWGALFRPEAFESAFLRYGEAIGFGDGGNRIPDELLRWSDVIFSSLTSWSSVDLGHTDLPQATADNRMYRQADHYTSQEQVEQRCIRLGGTVRRAPVAPPYEIVPFGRSTSPARTKARRS